MQNFQNSSKVFRISSDSTVDLPLTSDIGLLSHKEAQTEPPCMAVYIDSIGFLLLTGRGIYIPFAHNTNNSKIANIKNYNTRPKPTS